MENGGAWSGDNELVQQALLVPSEARRLAVKEVIICSSDKDLLQLVSEGGLSTVQHPKLHIVSDIVLAGHDFGSGGRADGVGKTISKAQTFCGKLV